MTKSSMVIKFSILWVAVFLFRLIPWRAPNVEPMLAAMMPFSKRYGGLSAFMFGASSIVVFDAVTSGWGEWTWVTAFTYGLLGTMSHLYFVRHEATRWNFVVFGVAGTLAFDAITGLTIGPVFRGQDFMLALTGQIPFTVMHLAGTILFSTLLSPLIYRLVVLNDALEPSRLWKGRLANN